MIKIKARQSHCQSNAWWDRTKHLQNIHKATQLQFSLPLWHCKYNCSCGSLAGIGADMSMLEPWLSSCCFMGWRREAPTEVSIDEAILLRRCNRQESNTIYRCTYASMRKQRELEKCVFWTIVNVSIVPDSSPCAGCQWCTCIIRIVSGAEGSRVHDPVRPRPFVNESVPTMHS